MRMQIFRAAIFMDSASARARLSAAVAATMSIPTKENRTLINVVLGHISHGQQHWRVMISVPDTNQCANRAVDFSLQSAMLIAHLVLVSKE
jgi:hypothetical protein